MASSGGRGGTGPVGQAHLAACRQRLQAHASRPQQQTTPVRQSITLKGSLAREGILPSSDRQPGISRRERAERPSSPRHNHNTRSMSPREGRQPLSSLPGSSGSGASGMPNDLPAEAERALSRRLERHHVRELAVPLGDGWMQRAGRGTFHVSGGDGGGGSDALRSSNVQGGSDSGSDAGASSPPKPAVMEVESSEPNFYLLTYDQTVRALPAQLTRPRPPPLLLLLAYMNVHVHVHVLACVRARRVGVFLLLSHTLC